MVTAEIKPLRLIEPFRIAHGTSDERSVLRVRWRDHIGEAPFVPYYPEDPEETLAWVTGLEWQPGDPLPRGPRAGVLALDLLDRDVSDGLRGIAVREGVGNRSAPPGCRSLSIPGSLDEFAEKVRAAAAQFRVLKLKLGSGDIARDEEIVARAREAAPKAMLFADANGGWSCAEAARILPRLARFGLEFVEQPVSHRGGLDAWRELRSTLASRSLPVFADESLQTADDVLAFAPWIDGVNVKLLKSGTVDGAVAAIRAARALGKQVLLGCMIESSVGVTAAAHLARLADWIDLDGHLWVANDDYEGIRYGDDGSLVLPCKAGIGVRRRMDCEDERP
jgi:L-alanine-DL-glutamate epimerase-like enolase superfamily enzyme